MRYLPINLDVRGRRVVVVGGGEVACRKVESLVECGALVTVISPEFCPGLVAAPGIVRVKRAYRSGDLAGSWLTIAATDQEQTNRQVFEESERHGIPCNVVDRPELCSFILPAVARRGDLSIAVSTDGISPALAGRLRRQLEASLDPALDVHLRLLAEMRPLVKTAALAPEARSRLLKAMAADAIDKRIADHGEDDARRYLQEMLAEAIRAARDQA